MNIFGAGQVSMVLTATPLPCPVPNRVLRGSGTGSYTRRKSVKCKDKNVKFWSPIRDVSIKDTEPLSRLFQADPCFMIHVP